MKKLLLLFIISTITFCSFAQTINKEFPYKDKKKDYFYYKGSFPVLDKKILTIFTFPDFITLHLYDEQLNEIATKDIKRKSEGNYSTDYYLSKKFLFVSEEVGKDKLITKISLDNDFSAEKFNHNINFYIDIDEANYYYPVSTSDVYFKRVNFSSKNTVDYKIDLAVDEKASVYGFKTFTKNGLIAVNRLRSIKKNSTYQVALHDTTGKELSSFNKLENNVFKSTVFFANNKNEVYVLGNYKEMPKKNDIENYENPFKNPSYTGIYIKSMNAEKPIEKYYKYSEFKNFNKQLVTDKKVNDIPKFRFRLEDMVFLDNEKIVFATIDKDSYLREGGSKSHDGQELVYVLIFGINNNGEIVWDQVISLDWKNHPKPKQNSFCKVNDFPKTVHIEKAGNRIKCHYSFKEKINYFELENGQIVNNKETLYVDKPNHTKIVEYQYKQSIYWYDNFYFNHDERGETYFLDKIEFNK